MPNVGNEPALGSGNSPDKICYDLGSDKVNCTSNGCQDGGRGDTFGPISSQNGCVYAHTKDVWTPFSTHPAYNNI